MNPQIASLIFVLGILGLFWLDRDRAARTSNALWLPLIWILINCSRPVSVWMGVAPAGSHSDLYLEGSPVDRAVFTCLLAAGLAVLIRRRNLVGPLLRRNGPILLFFSYCALSICWSDYPFVTFKHWTKGVAAVVMVLIVVTDLEPKTAVKRLLARTGFILLPLSLLLNKYYPDLGRQMTRSWTNSYAGVTLGKNELGMTCLILGLGSLWRFLIAYRDRGRPCRSRRLITHGALLAIVLWLFLMANSMTSLSCFILAGTVMTLASRPSLARSSSAVHLLVVAAVGISLFALFADRNMVTLVGRNPTLTGRTEIWDGVLSVPHNPVMGAGYESFFLGPRLDEFWSMPGCNGLQEAHNGYLEVYLNLGWIGVSLFAMVMANGYRKVIAAFRAKPEVSSLNVAYFVAAVIYSFTEAGFRMMSPIWTFFLWAIVAASQATSQEGLSVVAIDSTTDVAESESTLYDGLGVAFLRGPDESV